ncbi:polyisoprenoid-binding protein [Ktedonosporobacter rubrisoli]|uniref:Polyisoprenoid-binding protein n=1 Tax=Ktedonosporobacter rubrisoli TaxID=2509675 RepID=A0A4V0YZF6_KTERU|nr:YceI family protein [Ktedonosporobacter rubrisoli]QBD79551.1 polyisoprenoid-binding protein [Ktedonosporobacter rubrisoli]
MAWEIDPSHTLVEFAVVHLMINTVKGRFTDISGTIHLDAQQPETSWVKAQVKAASIQTGVAQRDAHLRSADFFDVSKFPLIAFESTRITNVEKNHCTLHGNLSLHGVTRPIEFQAEYTGHNRDPFSGGWRAGLYATTVIDRRDFAMSFEQTHMGIATVGYKVRIEINAEAILL